MPQPLPPETALASSLSRPALPLRTAVAMFLAFAAAYFLSALVRAITATISPTLVQELNLSAADLGLLASGYFLGFSLMQLPLGSLLDRVGPRKTLAGFLLVAVLGSAAFAVAANFWALLAARFLIGVGVCACLMAPLTAYRRWFSPEAQLRANSWMLMTGAFGMLASTLPVHALMPILGWRGIFWGLAAVFVCVIGLLWVLVPPNPAPAETSTQATPAGGSHAPLTLRGLFGGYEAVWRHPYFKALAPMALIPYGGAIAVQTLWAGPWLTQVAGVSSAQAASGLFGINAVMLVTFWLWGSANPSLARRGIHANTLLITGYPLALAMLTALTVAGYTGHGGALGWWAWGLFFVGASFVNATQPALGQVFPAAQAGRAMSAMNLLLFVGAFLVQWLIGLLIDGFLSAGLAKPQAYAAALGVYTAVCIVLYVQFCWRVKHWDLQLALKTS